MTAGQIKSFFYRFYALWPAVNIFSFAMPAWGASEKKEL